MGLFYAKNTGNTAAEIPVFGIELNTGIPVLGIGIGSFRAEPITLGCGLFCKFWGIIEHMQAHLKFGEKGPKTQKLTKNTPIWSCPELSNLGHASNKIEKSKWL